MCRLAETCYTFKEHHRSTTCRLAETCYTFKEHHRSTTCRLAEKCYTFTNTTGAPCADWRKSVTLLPTLQEHTLCQHYRSTMSRLAEKCYTFTNTTGAYTLPALQEHHEQTGREVLHFYQHYRSIHFASTTGAPWADWQRSVTLLPTLQEHTLCQHYRSTMCRLAEKCYTFTNTTGAYTLPALQEHHVQTGREVLHFNFTSKAPNDTRRRRGGGGSGEGEKTEEEGE